MVYVKNAIVLLVLLCMSATSAAQITYAQVWVGYGQGANCGKLQIVPVFFIKGNDKPAIVPNQKPAMLHQAIANRHIRLREMPSKNGADINWLEITNNSKQPVLVHSGDLLGGGKQDRMVAETKIITPGTTDYLHVFCVEKRRWDDKPKNFSYGGTASIPVRRAMDMTGRQQDVWREIDKQFAQRQQSSHTWSYLEIAKNTIATDTACLRYFNEWYNNLAEPCAGFMFITGKQLISAELFASSQIARWAWSTMLTANLRQAITIGDKPNMPTINLHLFADSLLQNEREQKEFLNSHGKYNLRNGKIVHIVAYGE